MTDIIKTDAIRRAMVVDSSSISSLPLDWPGTLQLSFALELQAQRTATRTQPLPEEIGENLLDTFMGSF